MNTSPLYAPAEQFREYARQVRRLGVPAVADVWEEAARMVENAVRAWEGEPLTLRQAAEESGYSYSTLQQNVKAGLIPNAGSVGRPRILRCDLPHRGARADGIASKVLVRAL